MAGLSRAEVLKWLCTEDEEALCELRERADAERRRRVGDQVHLRGLIEISNHCVRSCHYCGLRGPNHGLKRYRLTREQVLQSARLALSLGYGTVVIQSGEDPGLTSDWVTELIETIRRQTRLAVTLSLGERSDEELAAWRYAGADRYLLRFETSRRDLYERIHPPLASTPSDRIRLLRRLRELGYEMGTGMMIGIPGQTLEDLTDDIMLLAELDPDMIGLGPFVPHPDTPLGKVVPVTSGQAPNSENMVLKVLALVRLVCPMSNIPATTALASIDPEGGYEAGLRWGANVIMPNVSPAEVRKFYQIYPGKVCVTETIEFHERLVRRIQEMGRSVGVGRGDSAAYLARQKGAV